MALTNAVNKLLYITTALTVVIVSVFIALSVYLKPATVIQIENECENLPDAITPEPDIDGNISMFDDGETFYWHDGLFKFDNHDILATQGSGGVVYVRVRDKEGNQLCKITIDDSKDEEIISDVVDNGDGTYTLFNASYDGHIYVNVCDAKGNVRRICTLDTYDKYEFSIAMYEDGYVLMSGSDSTVDFFDKRGKLQLSYTFPDSEDIRYYYQRSVVHNGKAYVAMQCEGYSYDCISEESHVISDYCDVTENAKKELSLLLCVFDLDDLTLQKQYKARGSVNSRFKVSDNDTLLWEVECIRNAQVPPVAVSSYRIEGMSCVNRYEFNGADMVGHTFTGEFNAYYY